MGGTAVAVIYLWGNNAVKAKEALQKELKMKWSRKKRRFYREKVDRKTLRKIMSYCMKNKINYRTDDGKSYEVIESEAIEASHRELKDWGSGIPRGSSYSNDVDYEQMWSEGRRD